MVGTLLNFLFGCRHRRLTRPITPVQKFGVRRSTAYVACLECGKQFHYDVVNMQLGPEVGVGEMVGPEECRPFRAQY